MCESKMGGRNKKRFQCWTDSSGAILYLRALQGHSGRNPIDSSQQDNVLIPDKFFEFFCHIGCAINVHSITNSGLIAGGQNLSKRQTVFFLLVNSMDKDHKDPHELDPTKPRLASYKQQWKGHQDSVYWVDIQLSLRKGLKFYQTRCNAIILYDTLPAYCISKVVVLESGEITYEKENASRPPNFPMKNDWMKELDSEVAGSSEDTQRIQTKPKTKLSRTVRPVVDKNPPRRSRKISCLVTRTSSTQQERWEPWVGWNPFKDACRCLKNWRRRSNKNGETRGWTRVHQGGGARHRLQSNWIVTLSCEGSRTSPSPRACNRIETHPHRAVLQADLQQKNVYNPFSNNSKEMMREMCNVELFELCETTPKVHCSRCLLHWNQGIVYCICGHCLFYREFWRKFNKLRLVHSLSRSTWSRKAPTMKCKDWDELAKEDHTYKLTPEEKRRYQGQWNLILNKSDKNEAMKLRSDYRAAVLMKNRLHHESGEPIEEPVHPGQRRRIRQGQEVFSEDYLSSARVDQHAGWQYWPSFPSSSWWYASEWSWKWAHKIFCCSNLFLCYSWFRLQDHLYPKGCVNRTPSHRVFSRTFAHILSLFTCTAWLEVLQRVSHKKHVHPLVIMCLIVRCLSIHWLLPCLSSVSTLCPFYLSPISWSSTSMWSKPPSTKSHAHPQNEECCSVGEARPQQFVIGNDETELALSVESRSFFNRVNDRAEMTETNFKY